jgi:hypothetical protein
MSTPSASASYVQHHIKLYASTLTLTCFVMLHGMQDVPLIAILSPRLNMIYSLAMIDYNCVYLFIYGCTTLCWTLSAFSVS